MRAGGYARSMSIRQLLAEACGFDVDIAGEATGLSLDSRDIRPGDLFCSLARDVDQRRQHVAVALAAGAVAVLLDANFPDPSLSGVDICAVPALRDRLGAIAGRFFGNPERLLAVTGVTGTNGKTSVSHFLAQLITCSSTGRAAVIGTLGYGFPGQLLPLNMTTPDPVRLQEIFSNLVEQSVDSVVMEVSSHGLAQGRVLGVPFRTAILTNLTRDHLDYHGDMRSYAAAKRLLFHVPGLETAVLNLDDPFGRELLQEMPAALQCVGYGTGGTLDSLRKPDAVVTARCIIADREGLSLQLSGTFGSGRVRVPLIGGFNIHNLLAAAAGALSGGMSMAAVLEGLAQISPVAGRMERFGGCGQLPLVVVDFAHTPDGLGQALKSLRAICSGRLVCVFGCGGDRDRGKRPLMGAVAEEWADQLILTSDNPRTEDPHAILQDIASGLKRPKRALQEVDRAHAIGKAIADAGPEDIVLVAGKGHEDYQEGPDGRLPCSDKTIVQQCLGGNRA